MKVPNAATEKELKEISVDIEKEYSISESIEEAPSKPLLNFSQPVEE